MFGRIRSFVVGWLCRFCPRERIEISSPAVGATVVSPVTVSGEGQAVQHNQLAVRVRDGSGNEIGTGTASVTGPLGQRGAFTASVAYTLSGAAQAGRVEVYDTSPRDGNLVHLSSVEVGLS